MRILKFIAAAAFVGLTLSVLLVVAAAWNSVSAILHLKDAFGSVFLLSSLVLLNSTSLIILIRKRRRGRFLALAIIAPTYALLWALALNCPLFLSQNDAQALSLKNSIVQRVQSLGSAAILKNTEIARSDVTNLNGGHLPSSAFDWIRDSLAPATFTNNGDSIRLDFYPCHQNNNCGLIILANSAEPYASTVRSYHRIDYEPIVDRVYWFELHRLS